MNIAISVMGSYKLKYEGNGFLVHIDESVLKIWNDKKQIMHDSHESFGVIIGSCSLNKDEFWIDNITTPFSGDTSTRYSFELNDSRHQKVVDKAFKSSNGQSVYFGTWHTHPENHPIPSNIDIKDWKKCVSRNKDRKLFFVIVGIKEIRLFINHGSDYDALAFSLEHNS